MTHSCKDSDKTRRRFYNEAQFWGKCPNTFKQRVTACNFVAFGKDSHWQQPVLGYAMAYASKIKQYYTQFKAAGKVA